MTGPRICGIADLPAEALAGAVVVRPGAALGLGSQRLAGRIFPVELGGRPAAGFEIRCHAPGGLEVDQIFRRGELVAEAFTSVLGGLTMIEGLSVYRRPAGAMRAWSSNQAPGGMRPELRAWRRALAATAARSRIGNCLLSMPCRDRPRGTGQTVELHLVGEVTAEAAADLVAGIGSARGQPLRLIIDSPGGLVESGQRVIAALNSHDRRTETHVKGRAASMAAMILLAGDRRTAEPAARIVLHDPEMVSGAGGSATRLRMLARDLDRVAEDFGRSLSAVTGADSAEAMRWVRDNRSFMAGEAVAAGILHEVVSRAGGITGGALRASAEKRSARIYTLGEAYERGEVAWHRGRRWLALRRTFAGGGSLASPETSGDWERVSE